MNSQRSLPVRILRGLWQAIDGARKVFLNLLFLLLIYLLWVLVLKPEEPLRMRGKTTLVVRPYGVVVEEYSGTPLDRALQQLTTVTPEETRLRDLVGAIDRAADDGRISQMVIETDYMWGIGLASLQELERAVTGFKARGKPVVAMADVLGQQQYYLAALADEIWLSPDGLVWIDGYSNYRHFYRDGLEKLAVEVNLFRAGEYKSAMEPFVRDDMSPEAKEDALFWIGSLWQQYLDGVSRNRGVPLETLSRAIDEFADRIEAVEGDFAAFALQLGLVDRLISRPQARQELAARAAPNDAGDSYRAVGVEHYLEITDAALRPAPANRIAVVVAEGEILPGHRESGRVGAESTAGELRSIGRDSDVKAVVLRVDSPGGEIMASELIRREVQALRDGGRTVVVSMGDVAASGGYWISMGADEVWASPATITGSIGVYGMIPTFAATLDKIGIHADGVGTTRMAGKLRIDRPLDPDLRRIFQASTEHAYRDFVTLVAEAREMSPAEVHEVARGRVWSGAQAVERKLVDRTGTLKDAIDAAARIAGLGADYAVTWSEPEVTAFEGFVLELTSGAAVSLGRHLTGEGPIHVGLVQRLLDDVQRLLRRDGALTIAAHCLCGIE